MPLTRKLIAALAATALAVLIAVPVIAIDIATSRADDDSYARGAVSFPVVLAGLFVIYLALANIEGHATAHPYCQAALRMLAACSVLVVIPGIVWIAGSHESLRSPDTYLPWLIGLALLFVLLLPGALLQVPLLKRHNKSLERTREG
jgi:hypothetical protein